jgi:hypothetical protein
VAGDPGRKGLHPANIEYRIVGFGALTSWEKAHTGAAEDTGHLDELNGLLAGIHLERKERALSSRVGVGWTEGKRVLRWNLPCVGSCKLREGSGLDT